MIWQDCGAATLHVATSGVGVVTVTVQDTLAHKSSLYVPRATNLLSVIVSHPYCGNGASPRVLLFSSITLTILLLSIYKFTFLTPNKKHLPPSPPGALPIIGHLRLLFTPLHRTLQAVSANSDQYADYMLLKLGTRNVLVLSSPAAVQECFQKKDVAFANRPRSIGGDYNSYDYTNVALP
ncbi:hypothetical protein Scep_011413 [Stephania cephalantha]|uniref:Cytochrome P450 n=1 Tax=Stephania cephalantha TaxID=152367 RepID=A0AAP0JE35_9MAGN